MVKLKVNPNPPVPQQDGRARLRRATPPLTDADIAEVERRAEELRRRDPGRPLREVFWEAAAPVLARLDTDPFPPSAV